MPEPDEQLGQRARPRLVDRVDEELRRPLADALERDEPLDGEVVDVGGVVEEPGVDELRDPLLAETLDVHRRTTGEEHDALHALRRAVDVDAPRVGLALEAHERLVAHRAVRGELPPARALLALGEHRTDDLGDDVAGLAHDDGVADAHVLARHLVLVVQRREPDGGTADEHRLELRERRGATRCGRCSP